jgi:hypothetical protein
MSVSWILSVSHVEAAAVLNKFLTAIPHRPALTLILAAPSLTGWGFANSLS